METRGFLGNNTHQGALKGQGLHFYLITSTLECHCLIMVFRMFGHKGTRIYFQTHIDVQPNNIVIPHLLMRLRPMPLKGSQINSWVYFAF